MLGLPRKNLREIGSYFELLAASAKSANQSIEALARLLKESNGNVSLAELAVARRNGKRNAETISEELVKVFATALEREDIKAENDKMQELEGRADQLVLSYLKKIYSGRMGPIVGTKVLTPRQAIALAASTNLPAAGIVAYLMVRLFQIIGWIA